MQEAEQRIRRWLSEVVIGFNFCPFARREFEQESIRYVPAPAADLEQALSAELALLDRDHSIETTLIILEEGAEDFDTYLDLLDQAQSLLEYWGYEGVYQLASFHPAYRFADSGEADAGNATNRSPLPLIHLLREDSVEAAVARHREVESIPGRNLQFAREQGSEFWRRLLGSL